MSEQPHVAAYLHIDGFDDFRKLDFDRKPIRKAFIEAGKAVQRESRELVGRAMPSRGGQYPGRGRGILRRSIRYKVSRPGFLVKVAPQRTGPMNGHFYPAYLHYGVKSKGRWRIKPRKNYMEDALIRRGGRVKAILRRAFAASLQ